MKTVYKPWGKEEWLELNDKYCYKRIYINAGHKTSLQLHNFKTETNYIVSGEAHVTLGDSFRLMSTGDFFTVKPGTVHRVEAITDLILQEVSTPEVDDVVRLEDDTNRADGKLDYEIQRPALCILTAGRGTRIEKYTKWTNKALIPIGEKAAISHIIDGVSDDYDIIIALGYKAIQVQEYIEAAHPERNITFVHVDDFEGENSGPGYSLKCCQKWLERPFIWAVSDCYIDGGTIPPLDGNWVGVSHTSVPEIYSTFKIEDEKITDFSNKSENGYEWAFIGLAGIFDYKTFWSLLKTNEAISPFYFFDDLNPELEPRVLKWHDVGTIDSYQTLIEKTGKLSLDKTSEEFTYHVGKSFIKLFGDSVKCKRIVDRGNYDLKGLTPEIQYAGDHIMSYDWIDGKTIYNFSPFPLELLTWLEMNMWDDTHLDKTSFIKDKLEQRVPDALNSLTIRWEYVESGYYGLKVHGDLQFDNIIWGDDGKFYLIDWRDSFDKSIYCDIYYDLGKLYGGILIDYSLAKKNIFVQLSSQEVRIFERWVKRTGYNLTKIKWNTALIWLAMIPMHSEPFSSYLKEKALELIEELNA